MWFFNLGDSKCGHDCGLYHFMVTSWYNLLSILEPSKFQWLTASGDGTNDSDDRTNGSSWRKRKWPDFRWYCWYKHSLVSKITPVINTHHRLILDELEQRSERSAKVTSCLRPIDSTVLCSHPQQSIKNWLKAPHCIKIKPSKCWKRAENSKVSKVYRWLKLWSVWWDLIQLRSQLNTRTQLRLLSWLIWIEVLPSLIQLTLIHLYQESVSVNGKEKYQNWPATIFFQTILGFGDPLAEHVMTWFDPWLILTSFGSSIQETGAN